MSYNYGTVYRIVCLSDPDIQYVGSTFNDIHQRYKTHKNDYTKWKKGKSAEIALYPYVKDNWKNFKILPIKRYLVYREHNKDRKHLHTKEQLWISKLPCVNINNSFRIPYMDVLYKKLHYEENKYEILEKQAERNKRPEVIDSHRLYNKQYRENNYLRVKAVEDSYRKNPKNIVKAKQYSKIYREENKDKIKAQRSNKMTCICGSSFNKDSRARHNRTMKHQNYINNQ